MQRLTKYDTYPILVADIYYDPEFNCRSEFTLDSTMELANSIQEAGGFPYGLKYPITVQLWDQQPGYRYRLLAGARRLRAVMVHLKWTEVPATIVEGLSEFEARKLNLLENLERSNLNIVEEARAIRRLFPNNGARVISRAISRPGIWVTRRLRILTLPEKVQTMLAAGLLLATDVVPIASVLDDPDAQIRMAEKIMEARRDRPAHGPHSGSRASQTHGVRKKKQIEQMIARMLDAGVAGLAPRMGAWCLGNLTDDELLADIEAELKNHSA
jgi:ParB family chromosome partitioning protein